jgi:hypothetical protein
MWTGEGAGMWDLGKRAKHCESGSSPWRLALGITARVFDR